MPDVIAQTCRVWVGFRFYTQFLTARLPVLTDFTLQFPHVFLLIYIYYTVTGAILSGLGDDWFVPRILL